MPDDPEAPEPPPHSPEKPTRVAGESDALEESAWRRADDTAPELGDETLLAPPAAPIHEILGDYEILGKLGQGGMGAVYRARQISLDRQVALKLLPANFQADPDFVTRFQREARVAASLSHGHLVKVYASGQIDGTHFIAMELVEGETLGAWLKRGPLPPVEALRILHAATSALAYGWQRAHLIHRDIKPGNIFLSEQGEVKVGDLGLAKSIGTDTTGLTHTGTAMGTPHYISPEQARGEKDLDFRADIYSLGCTLYQMLTGRTPYTGTDPMSVMVQHINAPPPAILKVLPGCPLPLARLVGKMLKKLKRERHATYEELLAQIESVQTLFAPSESPLESTLPADPDATLLATPATAATRAKPPSTPPAKSTAVRYGGIAGGVAILGAIAFFAWPKPKEQLTKAQIAMMEREAAAKAATPAPLRSAPPPPAAEAWQDLLADPDRLSISSRSRIYGGQLELAGTDAVHLQEDIPDAAIRMTTTFQSGNTVQLWARRTDPSRYELHVANENVVGLQRRDGNTFTKLGAFPLPKPLKPGEDYELEFRAAGSNLTVKFNRTVIGQAVDDALPRGRFSITTLKPETASIKALQLLPLDPSKAASALPAAENWQPIFTPEEMARNRNVEFKDGRLLLKGGITKSLPSADGAIRARFTYIADGKNVGLGIRSTNSRAYKLMFLGSGRGLFLEYLTPDAGSSRIASHTFPKPLADGASVVLELRAIGQRLIALADGQQVIDAEDDRLLTPGWWGVMGQGGIAEPPLFAELSTTPAASSNAPSPATAPFVNTLGMKFVPVPITGGPTNGQRVLFSIWETRAQDYNAFAAETSRRPFKSSYTDDQTHPVLQISWEDAQAFCVWLTARDRQAGRIAATERYRLPTDHEWSCAVGIGSREDPAQSPTLKNDQFPEVYIWGAGWPPPPGIGNFRLPSLPDPYPDTSPVGSFAANAAGLHDLAANAWEWCEDGPPGSPPQYVLRGGSFMDGSPSYFLASHRISREAGYRSATTGFRVVLAPAP